MKSDITKEQAYNAFLRGHNGLTPDDNTSCALAAHSLGRRSGLASMDEVIYALQTLGFEFDQEKVPQVTTIQAYNWLRKYYKGSQTTVDIIRTARGQLALVVATWEANGEVDSYLFCQIENETQQDLVTDLVAGMFPRCDHSVILEQMAKESTEVV
jgi:hypothetical protein